MEDAITVLLRRFWSKVDRGGSKECWNWTAGLTYHGYGIFYTATWTSKRTVPAHRLSYAFCHGPVPPDIAIHHLCGNRKCVNPAHLQAVPRKQHSQKALAKATIVAAQLNRSRSRSRACCIHGHPWTPENTYTRPDGSRICRECAREHDRKRAEERRAYARRRYLDPSFQAKKRAYNRRYYIEHAEEMRTRSRKYRREHPKPTS